MGQFLREISWETYKKMDKFKSSIRSCSMACMITHCIEEKLKSYIVFDLEIDSEQLSTKFSNEAHEFFNKIENLEGRCRPEDIEFYYDPKILGGDNYNLCLKTYGTGKTCLFDIFTCFVGMKFQSYCSHIVRSTILGYSKEVVENYKFMISVHNQVIKILKHGMQLSKVYVKVQSFAKKKNPNLAKHLENEFGFELCPNIEKELVKINVESKAIAKEGMIFAINTNLIGLYEADKEYNLYVGNTVVVEKEKPSLVLTRHNLNKVELWHQPN